MAAKRFSEFTPIPLRQKMKVVGLFGVENTISEEQVYLLSQEEFVQVQEDAAKALLDSADAVTKAGASPNALTRKDYVDARVDAIGLAQGGSGAGGTSVTFSTTGKTLAIAYLRDTGSNKVYPVTFAIAAAVQHGVKLLNRGGENADKDFDLQVAVSVSGTNMTLTTIAGNRCNGIWQAYTM